MNQSPIVITGMHRSGTSLISKILLNNDVNLGSQLDINYESIYFQRINKWIMSCNGSSWDNPKSFNDLNNDDIHIFKNKLKGTLNNRFSNSFYFGYSNFLLNHSFFNLKSLWGWKDPSNTFTVIVWKEIFPNMKIVNIIRDPLSVCNSLLIRQSKLRSADSRFDKSILPYFLPLLSINRGNVLSSFNIENINDCLNLYKKYLKQMKSNEEKFGDNFFNVKYEELLNNPEKIIQNINDFCEIKIKKIDGLINLVHKNNINKYKNVKHDYSKDLLNDLKVYF